MVYQVENEKALDPKCEPIYKRVNTMSSKLHEMYIRESSKLTLHPFCDKRRIADNGIDTFPFNYFPKKVNVKQLKLLLCSNF
jgi:hypothetical protein